MDLTEYDVKLKELEEDCIEELCHILSVVKADDDPLGVSSTLLKQIAEVLPRSSEVLETLDGMTPDIMYHQEIILTITEEYQQMKRKLLLRKRMVKNRERMNLTTTATTSATASAIGNNLVQKGKDNLLGCCPAKPLETIKIVLKTRKNKNPKTTSLEPAPEDVSNERKISGAVDVSETKSVSDVDIIVETPQLVVRKPREIPVETIPELTEVLDVVVAEVVNPSKIFIQKASEYDKLNKMMDCLDQHYQLVLKEKALGNVDTMSDKISIGDFVAITWTDNMWYRGKVIKYQDYQTLKVFYIDYGTTADIKRSCMYKLDSKFFELPAQAMNAELGGIEPPLDEAQSIQWSGYPTRRLLELACGSHLRSLVAVITYRRKDKVGIWLLDHKGQGINETLVHEGFAKFIDTDENLMNMLSSGEDTNKEFELLNRVTALNEDILNLDPNEEDPYKVRTILLRSWRLYEQLNTLIEDYK